MVTYKQPVQTQKGSCCCPNGQGPQEACNLHTNVVGRLLLAFPDTQGGVVCNLISDMPCGRLGQAMSIPAGATR